MSRNARALALRTDRCSSCRADINARPVACRAPPEPHAPDSIIPRASADIFRTIHRSSVRPWMWWGISANCRWISGLGRPTRTAGPDGVFPGVPCRVGTPTSTAGRCPWREPSGIHSEHASWVARSAAARALSTTVRVRIQRIRDETAGGRAGSSWGSTPAGVEPPGSEPRFRAAHAGNRDGLA